MDAQIRSRIAPTPSGYLHLGNAHNFLLAEALSRAAGGSLRLRIDDLDAPRIREQYINDVFESLHWLGISPDCGPADAAAHTAGYSQAARLPQYGVLLRSLAATGKVFACTCSRADIQRDAADDGQYPGTCRDKGLSLDTPGAGWRFRTDEGAVATWDDGIDGPQAFSLHRGARDFIVRRRDGLPAYHVASLSDDVAYGIGLIVRGADLRSSTAAQLYLAAAIGLESFTRIRFYHHPLLLGGDGGKLSKSAGSTSLRALRAAGVSPAEIRGGAARWYGAFLHR